MYAALWLMLGLVGLLSIGGLVWLNHRRRDEFDDPDVGTQILDEHRRPTSRTQHTREVDVATDQPVERTGGKHRL